MTSLTFHNGFLWAIASSVPIDATNRTLVLLQNLTGGLYVRLVVYLLTSVVLAKGTMCDLSGNSKVIFHHSKRKPTHLIINTRL